LPLYQAILARMDEAVVAADFPWDEVSPLTILEANPAFERLSGYSRAELIGQSLSALLGDLTTGEALEQIVEGRVAEGRGAEGLVVYPKHGGPFQLEVDVVLQAPARGRPGRRVLIGKQRRLRCSPRPAHTYDLESIARLAGGVAHEFNNILTAILGYSELLLEELPQGGVPRDDMLQIKHAGERAKLLTRQLLAFSGKQVVRPEVVALDAFLRERESMLRTIVGGASLGLSIEGQQAIMADAGHVAEICAVLVRNAGAGAGAMGRVHIGLERRQLGSAEPARGGLKPGAHVVLTISNTGAGMTPDSLARVFEPFFGCVPSGGEGLGLSAVYGMVQQNGGHIEAESDAAVGCTFRVYFPAIDGGAPRVAPREDGQAASGGTVLVLEDEESLRLLVRRVLERQGYTVLEAADGEQGVELAEHHDGQIDLLLTDLMMPILGGREAAELIARQRPDMKVLFMSGFTSDLTSLELLFSPHANFLPKPFTPERLGQVIREALARDVQKETPVVAVERAGARGGAEAVLAPVAHQESRGTNMTQMVSHDVPSRRVAGEERHLGVLGSPRGPGGTGRGHGAPVAALGVVSLSPGGDGVLGGIAPRALVVDLDASGARELCSHARSGALLTQLPVFGLARAVTDLTFAEAYSWGVDDVVDLSDLQGLIPRLRAVRALPAPGAPASRGSAVVVDSDHDRRAIAARALVAAGYEVLFAAELVEAEALAAAHDAAMVVAALDAAPDGAVAGVVRARAGGSACPWVISVPPALLRETRDAVADIERVALHDAYAPPDDILFSANEMASAHALDQRTAPRLLCGTRVWMRPAGGERDTLGYTYNMSEGGLFVRTLAPIEPNQPMWIELCAPRAGRRVRLTAVPRWQRPFGPVGAALSPPGVGLRITGGLPGDIELFQSGCRKLTLEMS
jgi:PAS domain S-box-containing protein